MNIALLQGALAEIKCTLEAAITTATYNGKSYDDGQRAKEALIRSQTLIRRLHEVVKRSLSDYLSTQKLTYAIHPPIGKPSPELSVAGEIKKKQQDIVVLMGEVKPSPETIKGGPLDGQQDPLGQEVSQQAIVIGIRSQLSSVDKNFDTLMERAFAETLNLRLRQPHLVMGEVYLLPVYEYDDVAMVKGEVAWRENTVPVEKFIRTFLAISGRADTEDKSELYKYERSALVLADFRQQPPKVYLTHGSLVSEGFLPASFQGGFASLSPKRFVEDIVQARLSTLKDTGKA